jgi:subtilisin family serine protease
MRFRNLPCLAVLAICCSGHFASAQTRPVIKGWHLLDKQADGYQGISLKQAYDQLRGRKSSQVIVAVMDGGIDTSHEDLVSVLWRNPKENPRNLADDDRNGYTDDYYGWNFLGNPNGDNVEKESSEVARVYHHLRPVFDNQVCDTSLMDAEERENYRLWLKVNEATQITEQDQRIFNVISATRKALMNYDSIMRLAMSVDEYTLDQLENFKPDDKDARRSKLSMLNILNLLQTDKEQTNKDLLVALGDFLEQKEDMIRLREKPVTNYRRMVTGDDEKNWSSRNYGNSDVMGGDPLHGTHVAGIIGAVRNNGVGMDGIADNVRLMTVRAVPRGDEHDKDIALGIRYAVDNGAKIINMSFGKDISPQKKWVDDAIRYAASKDVLIVHAAGNESLNLNQTTQYPSPKLYDGTIAHNVITVGASSDSSISQSLVAPFTNYGSQVVDVLAPGVKIYSAMPNTSRYGFEDGTSMAAPVVSGIAAVLRSYFPELSAEEVKQIIERSADKSAAEQFCHLPGGTKKDKTSLSQLCRTGGIVNAAKAVELAMQWTRK